MKSMMSIARQQMVATRPLLTPTQMQTMTNVLQMEQATLGRMELQHR